MQWRSAPNKGKAPLPTRARSYWGTRLRSGLRGASRRSSRLKRQLPPWFVVGSAHRHVAWFADSTAHATGSRSVRFRWPGDCGLAIRGGRADAAAGWFGLALALGAPLVWAFHLSFAAPRLGRPWVTQFSVNGRTVETRTPRRLAAHAARRQFSRSTPLPPRVRGRSSRTRRPKALPGELCCRCAPAGPAPANGAARRLHFARDAGSRGSVRSAANWGPLTVVRPAAESGIRRRPRPARPPYPPGVAGAGRNHRHRARNG